MDNTGKGDEPSESPITPVNINGEQDFVWTPPSRSIRTGHRVSAGRLFRPLPTRKLNWRWWLAEFPMRILARSMRRNTTLKSITGEKMIDDDKQR